MIWPFWKWRHWKSIGFCLWHTYEIWSWNSKANFTSGNHAVYKWTDERTDKVNPVYPPPQPPHTNTHTRPPPPPSPNHHTTTPPTNFVGLGYKKVTIVLCNPENGKIQDCKECNNEPPPWYLDSSKIITHLLHRSMKVTLLNHGLRMYINREMMNAPRA